MDKAQIITYWQGLPWNEIKLKSNKYLPKFVFVLLIVLIIQTLAELTWQIFTPEQNTISNSNQKQVSQVKTAVANTSLKNVAAYHLFGDAKKPVVVQQKVIDAPETRLRIDLKGVFASTKPEQALAIISTSKGQDKMYRIGDKVTAGALLHAVYADRVILKRNGQLETLRLPKSKVDSKAFYETPSAKKAANNSRKTPGLPVVQVNSSQTQRLRDIRETLLSDPAKIWQQVRINPVMKNGQVHGYTMAHNDPKLMQELNIKSSDVITAVNGQPLNDPSTLYGLMNQLSDQQSLELSIERNGQPQTIQLNFN